MTEAVLGLGGNIGDTRSEMASALHRLGMNSRIDIVAVSPLYLTPPWGKIDQPPFLNAAALIETSLLPRALLNAILDVERELGRERGERWGPRTIDIDILVFGNVDVDEPWLHIPHPRLKDRAFALVPLIDVMPNAIVEGRNATEWLSLVGSAGITKIADAGWHEPDMTSVSRRT
jgi:2-amino-4-hydroxy-6-hydroxymethyldihydropteridine diphosphokinase